jgi:serine-type D-Ala-D-Ala carboxypeptidase
VLLANRVHPSRDNEAHRAFRPMVHDVVMETLTR